MLCTEGLGRDGRKLLNCHPVMMSQSLWLVVQGVAVWTGTCKKRKTDKWTHTALVYCGFIVANIRINVAYTVQIQVHRENFYSVHVWVGVLSLLVVESNVAEGIVATG